MLREESSERRRRRQGRRSKCITFWKGKKREGKSLHSILKPAGNKTGKRGKKLRDFFPLVRILLCLDPTARTEIDASTVCLSAIQFVCKDHKTHCSTYISFVRWIHCAWPSYVRTVLVLVVPFPKSRTAFFLCLASHHKASGTV